ncbi:MAG: methyltransferase domain-containing protein [Rubrivivax sp.]
MNHVLCDGGLCNRLNALLFALVLRRRFGGDWSISWPLNNWCRAPFEYLFSCDLPVDTASIQDYKARQQDHLLLMHENQVGFEPERVLSARALSSYEQCDLLLKNARQLGLGVLYFNNLLPPFAETEDVAQALAELAPNPEVARTASRFIAEHRISRKVVGLHIRKTDFGDAVDDIALYAEAVRSTQRYFVCTDSEEVSERFAALPNCAVFGKTDYPGKIERDANWLHQTVDTDGRPSWFNVDRSATSVVDALVDLLILSHTEIRPTSRSTFQATARLFQSCGYFAAGSPSPLSTSAELDAANQSLQVETMNTAPTAHRFNLAEVDENEHLIPRPYGTLQTLNLDHLYRYAFAKGFCFKADVLDAAMGCGYSSLLLNCKSYTGVDIDPNMVAFANEVYLPITGTARYLQGSVLELPVPDKSIDTYISFETIEHLRPSELPKYFAEVKRVLRPGGRFLCSTPIYRGDQHGLLTRYHHFEFRFQQFEATLLGQGFSIAETLYQWPPHFILEHVTPTFAQTQQAAPFLTVCVCQLPS